MERFIFKCSQAIAGSCETTVNDTIFIRFREGYSQYYPGYRLHAPTKISKLNTQISVFANLYGVILPS